MSQNFSQFLLGPTNPHDLFRVAREFLDSMTKGHVNAFGSSSHTTYPFAFSANQQISSRWFALLASAPNGFQGTLLRCINAKPAIF